jgi:TetR/AcrR family transcriptional regulator
MSSSARRWGDSSALSDDDEARRRLLEAATRCIERRGNTQIRMAEVADEAGVVRSTVYRYFSSRDELLLGLLLVQIDVSMHDVATSLSRPADAAYSLVEMMTGAISSIPDDALTLAFASSESVAVSSALEMGSDQIVDVMARHIGPILEGWQRTGQLHADIDLRDTLRWLHTTSLFLLSPPWLKRSNEDRATFIQHYLVRALVPADALAER